uniref:Uncharacterized protein n=1 Tax=Microseira wollei TaxID=467598 RepID=C3RVN5_9CYAN|nr:unknown [Microseira wollei]
MRTHVTGALVLILCMRTHVTGALVLTFLSLVEPLIGGQHGSKTRAAHLISLIIIIIELDAVNSLFVKTRLTRSCVCVRM